MKTTNKVPKETRMGRLERWLRDRRMKRTLHRYGGTQTCPWCNQCAQDNNADWHFDCSEVEAAANATRTVDVLTCGVCGGRSEWYWGLGMHYLRPLDHPAQAMLKNEGRRNEG